MKNKILSLTLSLLMLLATMLLVVSCGDKEEPSHTHTFAETWTSDSTGHWHKATCEHGSEKSNFTAHIGMDDCVCDVCGFVSAAHNFDANTYQYDDTHHWLVAACGNIAHTKDKAVHVDADEDCICDVCGRGNAPDEHLDENADCICDHANCGITLHEFGGQYFYEDGAGHYQVGSCGNVAHKDELKPHTGMDDCVCDDCGYIEHKYSSDLEYDENYHWVEASCEHKNEIKDKEEHTLNSDGECKCGYKDPKKQSVELPIIPA